MLYLIGTGLSEGDMTQKALQAIEKCESVYAEDYTSCLAGSLKSIEEASGRRVEMLGRERVESDFLVEEAARRDVALLVAGDPLAATTHFQLLLDAKLRGVEARVIHAPSVYSAIAATGLHIYKFGRSTTLAVWAMSPYDVAAANKERGLHTLLLLDTKEGEHTHVSEARDILLKMEKEKKGGIFAPGSCILACSCLGSAAQKIVYAPLSQLPELAAPVCFVLPGDLNFKEEEALSLWKS